MSSAWTPTVEDLEKLLGDPETRRRLLAAGAKRRTKKSGKSAQINYLDKSPAYTEEEKKRIKKAGVRKTRKFGKTTKYYPKKIVMDKVKESEQKKSGNGKAKDKTRTRSQTKAKRKAAQKSAQKKKRTKPAGNKCHEERKVLDRKTNECREPKCSFKKSEGNPGWPGDYCNRSKAALLTRRANRQVDKGKKLTAWKNKKEKERKTLTEITKEMKKLGIELKKKAKKKTKKAKKKTKKAKKKTKKSPKPKKKTKKSAPKKKAAPKAKKAKKKSGTRPKLATK